MPENIENKIINLSNALRGAGFRDLTVDEIDSILAEENQRTKKRKNKPSPAIPLLDQSRGTI